MIIYIHISFYLKYDQASYILVYPPQKPNPYVQVYQKPVAGNHNIRPTPG